MSSFFQNEAIDVFFIQKILKQMNTGTDQINDIPLSTLSKEQLN